MFRIVAAFILPVSIGCAQPAAEQRTGVQLLKFPDRFEFTNQSDTNLKHCTAIVDESFSANFDQLRAWQKLTISRAAFSPTIDGEEFYRRARIGTRLECDTAEGKPVQVNFRDEP